MRQSVEDCLRYWRPGLRSSMSDDDIDRAFAAMRPIIARAKKAEDEGRIWEMQPMMAMCNSRQKIEQGWFFMQIRYQPITDGQKGTPVIKTFTILEPRNARQKEA